MKKVICLVIVFSSYIQGGILDKALNFYSNNFTLSDPLNTWADAFRPVVKTFYKGVSIVGFGQGYDGLKQEYLYPPAESVPEIVRKQLEKFHGLSVTSLYTAPDQVGLLRNNAELGPQEKAFVIKRLDRARKIFAKAEQGQIFKAPDTNLAVNPQPYGFALDEGLEGFAGVPRIALCCSGGGFRAMIATLGMWKALSDIGIIDAILYSSNLSGSTWCTMPWSLGASLAELETCYTKYATKSMTQFVKKAISMVAKKGGRQKLTSDFLWEQPLSSARGIYGPLIGKMTLSFWEDSELRGATATTAPFQSSQYLYLWQALSFISEGDTRPFPIATALIPSKEARDTQSANGLWMEFNPEVCGFDYVTSDGRTSGAWIPTFALGRKCSEVQKKEKKWLGLVSKKVTIGYETTPGPVQTLDYWMGAWGSAYTISITEALRLMTESDSNDTPTSTAGMEKNDKGASIGKRIMGFLTKAMDFNSTTALLKKAKGARFFPAKFNNFALFNDSPFKNKKRLTAVDAGIDFNLPFPPLLRRPLELIIVGDFSSGNEPAHQLVLAEAWARKKGVPFPLIKSSSQFAQITKQPMTLFNDYPGGARGPAILYIPLQDNQFNEPGFSVAQCMKETCSTFNFNYGPMVQKLSNQVYRTVWGVYPQIREVVQAIVKAKNKDSSFTMTSLTALS